MYAYRGMIISKLKLILCVTKYIFNDIIYYHYYYYHFFIFIIVIIFIIRFLAESLVSFYNRCREIQTQFAVYIRIYIRTLLGINKNRKHRRRSSTSNKISGNKKNSVLEMSFLDVRNRISSATTTNNNDDDDQNSFSSSSDSDDDDNDINNDELLKLIEQQNGNRKVSEDLLSYIPLKQRLRTTYVNENRKHNNNTSTTTNDNNINSRNNKRASNNQNDISDIRSSFAKINQYDDEGDDNNNNRDNFSLRYDNYLIVFIYSYLMIINFDLIIIIYLF